MTAILQVRDLVKTYRTSEVETKALDGISMDVASGEFLAVMGPSGCGKSSLLNILGFLDSPTSGSVKIMGEDVATTSERDMTAFRRRYIGFVFQSFNLIDDLTVAENVEVALLYRNLPGERRKRVSEVLEQVGVAHRASHRPHQLSGGQQQRVAVARALAADPALILADEPTGNLDTSNGDVVMDLLKAASAAGTTIIMVTHSPTHAAMAGRTMNLLDGRAVDVPQV